MDVTMLQTFGVAVTYTFPEADPFSAVGIFQQENRAEGFTPGSLPILWVNLVNFTRPPAKGDSLTIGSAIYSVVGAQFDEEGAGAELFLQKRGDL